MPPKARLKTVRLRIVVVYAGLTHVVQVSKAVSAKNSKGKAKELSLDLSASDSESSEGLHVFHIAFLLHC